MPITKEQKVKKHTDAEVLYKSKRIEILSEAATDQWFLSVVLAYDTVKDEYITWLRNKQAGGYDCGNYFMGEGAYKKARVDFAERALKYSGQMF